MEHVVALVALIACVVWLAVLPTIGLLFLLGFV